MYLPVQHILPINLKPKKPLLTKLIIPLKIRSPMNESIILAIAILLGIAILVFAFAALYSRKLSMAIIAAAAVSLLASVLYLFLAAPDVAMTEAAIGSGLTLIIFFYVLNKIRNHA